MIRETRRLSRKKLPLIRKTLRWIRAMQQLAFQPGKSNELLEQSSRLMNLKTR